MSTEGGKIALDSICIFVLLERINHVTEKNIEIQYRNLSLKMQYSPSIQILLQARGLFALIGKPGSECSFQTWNVSTGNELPN